MLAHDDALLLLDTVAPARLGRDSECVPSMPRPVPGACKPKIEPDTEVVGVAAGPPPHLLNAAAVA